MPPSGHSSISPSGAERWWNCPGSVALCATQPPQRPSEAAAQGTVAHRLAEALVTKKKTSVDLAALIGTTIKEDGFDILIDQDMVNAVVLYWDIIKQDREEKEVDRPATVVEQAEVPVMVSSVDPDLNGTADYVMYQRGNILHVYDFKYGKGVVVAVEENKQLAIYAIGVLDKLECPFDSIKITIVQPRAPHSEGPVRTWTVDNRWIENFRRELKVHVAAAKTPNALLAAGKWCRWCSAKAVCPELFKSVQEQAKADFSVLAPSPAAPTMLPAVRAMPLEKLALALSWMDAIDIWFKAVHQRVQETLEAGGKIPGFKLVQGRSNRVWKDEKRVVEAFEFILGEKLYDKSILSPAELEKIVGKGKLEQMGLTIKPEGRKTVAPDNDPRPGVRPSVEQDFSVIPQSSKKVWP